MKIQKLISGLIFMCAIILLANENKTGLTGKVQDESGFGIMSGSLEVYSKDTDRKLIYKTTTRDNGSFTLANLEPGEYEIVAKAQGFEDKVQSLKIGSASADLGVITMDEDYISLDEVVIYGQSQPEDVVLLEPLVIYGKAK